MFLHDIEIQIAFAAEKGVEELDLDLSMDLTIGLMNLPMEYARLNCPTT